MEGEIRRARGQSESSTVMADFEWLVSVFRALVPPDEPAATGDRETLVATIDEIIESLEDRIAVLEESRAAPVAKPRGRSRPNAVALVRDVSSD